MSAIATLACLVLAPTGRAAEQVGQLPGADPDADFAANVNMVQDTVGAAPGYQIPSGGGVITAWQHRGDVATPGSGRLLLWRPSAGTDHLLAARSEIEAFSPGVVNTFATRIPVAGEEQLGMRTVTPAGASFDTALPGDVVHYQGGDPDLAPGETTDLLTTATSRRLNLMVTLEPDGDGDGFGDETQDACPTDPSTQQPCADVAPPDTTITAGPEGKTKRKLATFEFISSEAGSGFECSFDGEPFRPCASPEDEKVGKGKHEFRVRAVDAAGNADGSPATRAWKVKKKKKKRKQQQKRR